VILCGWLGGFGKGEEGQLLTIEQVGGILKGEENISTSGSFPC